MNLLSVDGITRYLNIESLEVATKVLGMLLVALAMETILIGLGGALGEPLEAVLRKLQEMGVLGW